MCGHHNSHGHVPGPAWMGWEPCEDVHCHRHGARAVLEAARDVVRRWEALGRCVDEFGAEDRGVCDEYQQSLDAAILGLRLALRVAAPSRSGVHDG